MTRLREWIQRLRGSLRPNSRELEMEEELRQHLAFAREDLESRRINGGDVQRAVRIEHGGLTQTMELMRDQRGFPWLDDLACDVRYGLRALRRNPGFTALAVVIMALGIGANTAVFSVVNAVLLKPLSYHNPDQIVTITNPLTTGEASSPLAVKLVSIPNFQDWHDQSSSFEAMAFYYSWKNPAMAGSMAEYAQVTKVSPEFFRVFAVQPVIGRFFNAEESKPGSGGALMISYAYWQSHFGGEPGVLGRTIRRYNTAETIVGVLPPGFRFPDNTDLWMPDTDNGASMRSRDSQNHYAIGRLKSGVSLQQAQTEITGIARRLEQQYPETNKNLTAVVTRLRDEMVGDIRLTLYLLLGAVSVVLLIACANTATLLLGKATVRNREIAVRASLGASQWRIGRQLFSESLLLAFLAGTVGLLLAYGGSRALIALAPAGVPRLSETAVDHSVLLFTFGASVLTSLLFGLIPGLYASQIDLNDALKQAGTRSVTGRGMVRVRGLLVVVEIALAVVLLSAAGLLIKSFAALQHVALGFRPENVLVMTAAGPGSIRDTNLFFKDVLSEIVTQPGVVAAGATMELPGHVGSSGAYYVDHLPETRSTSDPVAVHSIVTPGTFGALGIPLKSGRDFDENDTRDRPFVAVVNEELVKSSFSGQNPIGRTIFCPFDSDKAMTVIGVVGNVRENGPGHEPPPECYMSYRQHVYNNASLSIVTRTTSNPVALQETLRRLAHQRSPDIPVTFTTMEQDASENVAAPRFRTMLFGLFAGLAVCLAMVGIYSVVAYAVGQRSKEIGLRMALGASAGSVLRLILGQGLTLATIGLVLGLAVSLATTQLLTAVLFRVRPTDPLINIAVAVLVAMVTLSASYIPAWRASKIDPLSTLREE